MLNTQIFKATSTKLAHFLLAFWPEERAWVDFSPPHRAVMKNYFKKV